MTSLIRILFVIFAVAVWGCGNATKDMETSGSSQFASVSFSIRWQTDPEDADTRRSSERSALSENCSQVGVQTVQCKVYDSDGVELTSKSWNCEAGSGYINDIPPGNSRRFVVIGLDGDDRIVYRGQSDRDHDCLPGGTVKAGTIEAVKFVPGPLLSVPRQVADGTAVSLEWATVEGAKEYYVTISENSDFTGATVHGPTTETLFTPSDLVQGRTYYWHVQAADEYDNRSMTSSGTRPFMFVPNPLPDTGQNGDFTPTKGEDSDFDIHPPSYTKLAPDGSKLATDAQAWAMVRDNVTGLIWEVKSDDSASINDKENTYTWDGSKSEFIARLNNEAFGGYKTWRIPTIKELATLMHYDAYGPAIDTTYFPHTQPDYYWSSVAYAQDVTQFALVTRFTDGSTYKDEKTKMYHVRAVYDGQAEGDISLDMIVDDNNGTGTNEDDVVIDRKTGLMWQRMPINTVRTWEEALKYCENLTLRGYDDWRLPNIKEMNSILNHGRHAPALDANSIFTGRATSQTFWSSTTSTDPANRIHAFRCVVYNGTFDAEFSKTELYSAIAVRGGR